MVLGSIELMTAIDLAVIAVGVYVAILFRRNAQMFARSGATTSLWLIATGLFLIVLFFAADLFAMWVLPYFIGTQAAMSAMQKLHFNISWYAIPAAVCSLAIGFARSCGALSDLLHRVDTSEQALRENEERTRQLIDSSPDAIFVDCDDTVVFVNPAAVEIFGARSAGQIVGKQTLDFIHPDDHAAVSARRGQLEGDRQLNPITERRAVRLDGSEFTGEARAARFTWDGRPAYLVILRDITARKEAEQDLRESEERYRNLIEAVPDAMLVTRADRRITFANSAAVELFGADSMDRLIGRNMLELVHPQDRDDVEARREQVLQGARLAFAERRRLRLDGSEFFSESRGVPFTWHGDPAILIVVRDITDRKEAEEKLRQAQKMEAVGQLTAGVAHDFNNLLTVVLGNLDLLHENLGENRKQKDLAERAIRGATHGAELTHRLLAFSRKQTLAPEAVEAGRIIAGMTDLLRRTLGETVEIETVIDGGLWLCEADPGQLEETLLNLALNSRDAMPDGGRLTIEAGNARLDDEYAAAQVEVEPGQYVVLSVTDTGTGMAPEVREKVFEPFFTTKEVGTGTGLGLSMVYGFVKQSGGHVSVYSEEGEGTTIKIYLPRIMAEEIQPPPRHAVTDDLRSRGETVLVVEDDADLRTLAVSLLRDLGYTVLEAGSGAAALRQLETARGVNLLLTDVVLPGGMSGRVLADEARRRLRGIKVLFMSGYTENAIIHHGRLDPDTELLQKPFRKADLQRKVRLVLSGD